MDQRGCISHLGWPHHPKAHMGLAGQAKGQGAQRGEAPQLEGQENPRPAGLGFPPGRRLYKGGQGGGAADQGGHPTLP